MGGGVGSVAPIRFPGDLRGGSPARVPDGVVSPRRPVIPVSVPIPHIPHHQLHGDRSPPSTHSRTTGGRAPACQSTGPLHLEGVHHHILRGVLRVCGRQMAHVRRSSHTGSDPGLAVRTPNPGHLVGEPPLGGPPGYSPRPRRCPSGRPRCWSTVRLVGGAHRSPLPCAHGGSPIGGDEPLRGGEPPCQWWPSGSPGGR